LSKDTPEFGELPRRYHKLIQLTLEADLLVQAGREKDLPAMSPLEKQCVIAYQKAQNKVKAEDVKRRELEIKNNQ
jgi:hypothetical protein